MMGAYVWAEAVDMLSVLHYGHRFQEVNNPMLFTAEECYQEAQNTLKRAREAVSTATLTSLYTPLIEPEDRITTPEGERMVSEQQLTFTPGLIQQELDVREYVWGES